MDNYLTTCLVAFVFIFLLWCVSKLKNINMNHGFRNGFYYANETFSGNNFRHAIEELQGYVEESRTMGCYNDFDEGIEQSIKQNIADQCDIMNRDEGGNWYFCNESLKFKDSLTSREIIL